MVCTIPMVCTRCTDGVQDSVLFGVPDDLPKYLTTNPKQTPNQTPKQTPNITTCLGVFGVLFGTTIGWYGSHILVWRCM